MDITPDVHMLFGLSNQNIGWFRALAELVDNAFDANAARVIIAASKRQLRIEDDGDGIKDIGSAIRLGDHRASTSTALGMYGVGLKDAWFFSGDRIDVRSVRNGMTSKLSASKAEIIASDKWRIDDPEHCRTVDGEPSGTLITLHLSHDRRTPKQETMDNLAWAFTPALLEGKQIAHRSGKRKPKTLAPVQLPKFIDSVSDKFRVSGRDVAIHIGIVADGEVMTKGPFWIQYKHRNLTSSSIGIGQGFSSSRMGGVIVLGDGFSLTKNKDDFTACKDELSEAINSRIRFLLQKADQLSLDVESKALTSQLETRLNESVNSLRREKRRASEQETGTVVPPRIPTGRRRRKASQSSSENGSVEGGSKNRSRGMSVDFYTDDENRIGEFDPSGDRIKLNESHPFISNAKSLGAVDLLHSIAIAILSQYIVTHHGASQIALFEVQDFGQTYGSILKPMAEGLGARHAKKG